MNLEKIEKYLESIEGQIENASIPALQKMEENCQKYDHYLHGLINHLKKQKGTNLDAVRFTSKEVKKALKQIRLKKRSLKEKPQPKPIKKINYVYDEEMEVLNAIYQEEISKEEKIKKFKEKIKEYQFMIEIYEEEIKGFSNAKKECLETFYSGKGYRENEQKIKETKQEIYRYKRYIARCKTFIISLDNKKANIIPKKTTCIPKEEKENIYYYLILKELLKSDQNYYVIEKCIENNPMFLNATYKGVSIVFEILNLYLESMRKKVKEDKNENPQYYASLLHLFFASNIDLPMEERKRFMNLVQNMVQDFTSIPLEKEEEMANETEVFSLPKEVIEGYKFDALARNRRNLTKSDDLENSCTFAFQNQSYAFSFGYDKNFNTYFRIHILDTTFIPEDSPWYEELKKEKEVGEKHLKKLSHFKQGMVYPTFTFQFKILQNGVISSFKMFDSCIEIDKMITNQDMLSYREDEDLKRFVGCLKLVSTDYGVNEISLFSSEIEKTIDFILDIELKSYFAKRNLPALYYVEEELDSLEIYQLHTNISYFLSKISKKEVEQFLSCLDANKKNSFYTDVPLEESKLIMNPTCFIGYNILKLLKLSVNGLLNDELLHKYKIILEECQRELNEQDRFIDLEMQKRLKKVGE